MTLVVGALLMAGPTLASPNAPLLNAKQLTIKGERLSSGGCGFLISAAVPFGQRAVEVRELSTNLGTCTMVTEKGTPLLTPAERAPAVRQRTVELASKSDQGDVCDRGECGGNFQRRQGYVQARTEDPATADVNWVKDWLDFYWNTYTIDGAVCWGDWYKLTASGWDGPEINRYCQYSNGYQTVEGSTYAYFWNYPFCSGFRTDVRYNRNHAYGEDWGLLWGNAYVTRENGCYYWLRSHLMIVQTI